MPTKTFTSGVGSRANAIPERSSFQYEVVLTDPDGEAVSPTDISAIYLTLRDITSDGIVNSRSGVSVKDANGGTLASGLFTMQFDEADMPAVGTAQKQPRKLTLDIRLAAGGRMTREIIFWVESLQDVAAI